MPTLVDEPPEGDGWIHEIKHDGYRTQLLIENGKVRAFTRNGHDWTDRYRLITEAARELAATSAIVDGEMIATRPDGSSDFAAIRTAIASDHGRLAFIAFDLLHLDGQDLRTEPLVERRSMLSRLLEGIDDRIQFSQHVETSGAVFFAAVDKMGLEGMVSKRADSTYRSGPSTTWLKTKCYEISEFEVAGVLRERGKPAMALMATTAGTRRYVGSAFITLKGVMRERLWELVERGNGRPLGGIDNPAAEWLKPGLIGLVKHLKGEEKLRHASLQEIRETG